MKLLFAIWKFATLRVRKKIHAEVEQTFVDEIKRLECVCSDIDDVAAEYAKLFSFMDEYCSKRYTCLSGRGLQWRLYVPDSHGSGDIKIWNNDGLLNTMTEFKKKVEEETP